MKQLMLIIAPVGTRSGYGDHARDLTKSLMKLDYDIKIDDVRWGDTPRNALDKNNPEDKKILDCILKPGDSLSRQPDFCVDIRIPNEFNPVGKFNIGITAGVETTAVSPKFLEGCNKMDLIIVPSKHSKDGFVTTHFDKTQNTPDGQQQKVGDLRLEKPIETLFEAYDDTYKPLEEKDIPKSFLKEINDVVKNNFAFLHVGQWTKGGYGEDRKDIGKTVKIFYETFSGVKNPPTLLLKTSGATFSVMDREECLSKLRSIKNMFPPQIQKNLPEVILLHGDLTKEELNYLYNHPKIKSFVSFTHGEGFGRPLLEASVTGLPVIASNWSGQLDFLETDYSILVDGTMGKIPPSAVWEDIIIPESQWFNVNEQEATKALKFAFENEDSIKKQANSLMDVNRVNFSHDNMTKKFEYIINKYTAHLPKNVSLNLPTLKKATGDDSPKLPKLPKLKKEQKEASFPNI
tara:strand:+ start:1410 stop:2792 length:1383 start_codon:yes stop_codon:yes gene_type:complete